MVNLDAYMKNYDVYFQDGGHLFLEEVAISSKGATTRTVFIDGNGDTVFVVPDCVLKYIRIRK